MGYIRLLRFSEEPQIEMWAASWCPAWTSLSCVKCSIDINCNANSFCMTERDRKCGDDGGMQYGKDYISLLNVEFLQAFGQ